MRNVQTYPLHYVYENSPPRAQGLAALCMVDSPSSTGRTRRLVRVRTRRLV